MDKTRKTLTPTGSLTFDNATISRNMSASELLSLPHVKTEHWLSNAGYDTYRLAPLTVGNQEYIATVTFFDERIERVSFAPKTDMSSWDEVTEASIQFDGLILSEFMQTEFGSQQKTHSFPWGKIELWQDAKNAFMYSITVAYQTL